MFNYLVLLENEKEKELFKELYKNYKDEMFYISYEILHNKADAEDMVHETFLTIIEEFEKIVENNCHKTRNYIVTIIKNKSINLYHQKERRSTQQLEDWTQIQVFESSMQVQLEEKEVQEILIELLEQMNSPYREVLNLQYYHRLNASQIGKILGKTPDNIRHISQRAKKSLQKQLEERGVLNEDKR
ncbi:MAG: sigma-70 family RNA polymerase sigma factor [Lachnospiraceae bacterium]